jgi:S1-C subfamily serine protease
LTGVKVSNVLRGGAAERAGVSVGDELLAIDGWRIRRIDDAQRLIAGDTPGGLWLARDQRVLTLPLSVPRESESLGNVLLAPDSKPSRVALALRKAWFAG